MASECSADDTENKPKELSEEEIEGFRLAFSLFDKDGDGQNPTEEHLQSMINEFDKDGNGIIDWPEFLIMMKRTMMQTNTNDELKIAFRVFDKNNDGDIPADELRNVFEYLAKEKLMGITENEMKEMLSAWDTDSDGDVDFKEFIDMMGLK